MKRWTTHKFKSVSAAKKIAKKARSLGLRARVSERASGAVIAVGIPTLRRIRGVLRIAMPKRRR